MLKEIRKEEKCASCGHISVSAEYESYCDLCKRQYEKGNTYGRGVGYHVFNNSVTNLDDPKHCVERHFCSFRCLFTRLRRERLSKHKWIAFDFYLHKADVEDYWEAIAATSRSK